MNAINGLKRTGIYPLDSNIFKDKEFAAAETPYHVTGDGFSLELTNNQNLCAEMPLPNIIHAQNTFEKSPSSSS